MSRLLDFSINLTFFFLQNVLGSRIASMTYHRLFPYEPEMVNAFKEAVPNMVVMDVGAGVGYYAQIAAKCARLVVAVEPHPERFKILSRSLSNCRRVVVVKVFLSDHEGVAEAFEETYERRWLPFRPHTECPSRTYTSAPMHDDARKTRRVDTTTLDTLAAKLKLEKVDVIKVDVEGAELDVLRGGRQVLEGTRHLFLEFHYPTNAEQYAQCQHLLRELGFAGRKLSADGKYCEFYRRH
jgi:FkbM family methyltransferase